MSRGGFNRSCLNRPDVIRLIHWAFVLPASFCAVATGCKTNPTAAEISLSGDYVLESQDGRVVPFPFSPPTATNPCPIGVTYGQLSLGPAGSDFPASYSLGAVSGRVCDPDGSPAPTTAVVADAGLWSGDLSRLTFQSSPSFRLGTYNVDVQLGSSVPVLTLTLSGHNYSWRRVRPYPSSLVNLDIAVVDANGKQVSAAFIRVRSSDGIVTEVYSSDLHTFLTSVSEGPATVAVAPPPGYLIAPPQPNPITVSGSPNQITTVIIRLVKSAA